MLRAHYNSRVGHKAIVLAGIMMAILLFTACTISERMQEDTESTIDASNQEANVDNQIIKTLSDQIASWKEDQFYPGAYQKTSFKFQCPAERTSFIVEDAGITYIYGNPLNPEGEERVHMVRKYHYSREEDITFSEIPSNGILFGMYVSNGTIWLLVGSNGATLNTEESRLEVYAYDTDGKFKLRQKLSDVVSPAKVNDRSVTAFTDKKGNLWVRILEGGSLCCITPEGQLSNKVSIPTDFQGGFMRGRNVDELLAILGTETGLVLGRMDTARSTSDTWIVEGIPGIRHCFPGIEYDILAMTDKSLYGITLSDGAIVKELMNFTDIGIDYSILMSITDRDDGSFSAILYGRTGMEGEVIDLSPSKTKVHEGLILACLQTSEYLRYAVSQYNEGHPDQKVTIKEYYDKYAMDMTMADALNRLNSDIMDGTAGDIICLDGVVDANRMKKYSEKGIFLDIYEFMDSDPDFHKEDYFSDVWRVNETDGKLYRLVPLFTLNTKFGRESDVGRTTHLDESLLFETENPLMLFGYIYNRSRFIHDLMVFSLGDIFDNDAVLYDPVQVAKYIKVAEKLPEYSIYQENGEYTREYLEALWRKYGDYCQNNTLFYYDDYLQFDSYFQLIRLASSVLGKELKEGPLSEEAYLHAGTKVVFSGFPVAEGCGSAIINSFELAIPSNTIDSIGAWEFLKQTLSEEYQSTVRFASKVIPSNREVFTKYIQQLIMYQSIDDDPCWHSCIGGGNPETGEEYLFIVPATQQWMIDDFIDLLGDITIVDEVDPNVEAIVTEETAKYCDGRQTAEEAAKNIKERVELYADEQ